MINIRKSDDRGVTDISWLFSKHSFSFSSYYDPQYIHFHNLRVINEDIVKEGTGFATHPHNNMEILTYILDGELAHRDSMGNGSVIKKGEFQLMSAGTGITHSEYNNSDQKKVHLLQIWFLPLKKDVQPQYQQKLFTPEQRDNKFCLAVSSNGEAGSLIINQNLKVLVSAISSRKILDYKSDHQNKIWVQITKGNILLNGTDLKSGDGAAIKNESNLQFTNQSEEVSELLLFDMQP